MKLSLPFFRKQIQSTIINSQHIQEGGQSYPLQKINRIKKVKAKNNYTISNKWMIIAGLIPFVTSSVFYSFSYYQLFNQINIFIILVCGGMVYWGIRERRRSSRQYAVSLETEFGKLQLLKSPNEEFVEKASTLIQQVKEGTSEHPSYALNPKEETIEPHHEEGKSLNEAPTDPEQA